MNDLGLPFTDILEMTFFGVIQDHSNFNCLKAEKPQHNQPLYTRVIKHASNK